MRQSLVELQHLAMLPRRGRHVERDEKGRATAAIEHPGPHPDAVRSAIAVFNSERWKLDDFEQMVGFIYGCQAADNAGLTVSAEQHDAVERCWAWLEARGHVTHEVDDGLAEYALPMHSPL